MLTRRLGPQESVEVETLLFDVIPNERFLRCSDGLSKHFDDKAEVIQLLSADDVENIPKRLSESANDRGGQDNMNSIVFRARSDESVPATNAVR